MTSFNVSRFVNSSFIKYVSYDIQSATLRVILQDGRGYDYLRVPPRVYRGLALARSVGSFFNSQVKPQYRCIQVDANVLTRFALDIAEQLQADALLRSH